PVIQFDAEAIERLIHGQVVSAADAVGGVLAQAYSAEMQFIAIVEGNGGGWIPRKVFAQEVGL
ncbi:MAG: tRNA pseudouridine(55) synthase TruB, partial [Anaerolineae bacterium]|nr:tRNA pseudouridine(55) synthase TruB [Anaerolineae bacterium]